MPNTTITTDGASPLEPGTNTLPVMVAVLTEKVNQVIGDHERRISSLENKRDTAATRGSSLASPLIAAAALLVIVADKINWN